MEITLKTLTPIWTGGVETGKMERIHETGLIGSLRWWYEAIVRGLGGEACDPTKHSCLYDPEKPNNGLCDACHLFGATGWRRRFRLGVDDSGLKPTWSGDGINIKPPDRNRGWYLNAGKVGTFALKVIADERVQAQILALIEFVARYGSFGARPQLGYGLVEIVKIENQPPLASDWSNIGQGQQRSVLPDLRTFTFFNLDFEPKDDNWWRNVPGIGAAIRNNRHKNTIDSLVGQRMIPTTPALKDSLRYGKRWSSGALPHLFFGTSRGDERKRSQIALSWAYQQNNSSIWHMRGWAYPPQVTQNQKAEIQQRLQEHLGKPAAWLRALNISYHSATVSVTPTTTFFQSTTSTQIQTLIDESSTAEIPV